MKPGQGSQLSLFVADLVHVPEPGRSYLRNGHLVHVRSITRGGWVVGWCGGTSRTWAPDEWGEHGVPELVPAGT